MDSPPFRCKKFLVNQHGAAHPVGTDSLLIGAWVDVETAGRILDIGTGTGIIALMLAQRLAHLTQYDITAVEIDPASAVCAGTNFEQSPWAARLRVIESPVQVWYPQQPARSYDLIVSNPPFFTETILAPVPGRRQARSTISLHFGQLIEAVLHLLTPNGKFCVVLPVKEGHRLMEIATVNGLYPTQVTAVISKPEKAVERLLLQLERNPYPFQRGQINLEQDLKTLAGDFYL